MKAFIIWFFLLTTNLFGQITLIDPIGKECLLWAHNKEAKIGEYIDLRILTPQIAPHVFVFAGLNHFNGGMFPASLRTEILFATRCDSVTWIRGYNHLSYLKWKIPNDVRLVGTKFYIQAIAHEGWYNINTTDPIVLAKGLSAILFYGGYKHYISDLLEVKIQK